MIRNLSILLLLAAGFARADFSYTMTSKSSMGGNPSVSKYYYKGNKMKTETSNSVMIMDFDAQTVTTINPQDKSYTVKTFAETNKEAATATADVHPDFKDTGEKKVINGFNATQLLLTMDVDAGRGGQKAQMQMEMWISPDVPGVGELRGFYQRNMGKFPWASLGEGANPQMKAVTIEMYKKLAQMNGAAVLEVMHMKLGGAGAPDPSADPRMAAARARLEEMAKQGGQQGEIAKQQLARMGAMGGGGGMQITIEGSGFSPAPVAESVFTIPGDYKKR
jgi:hypothetical protein